MKPIRGKRARARNTEASPPIDLGSRAISSDDPAEILKDSKAWMDIKHETRKNMIRNIK